MGRVAPMTETVREPEAGAIDGGAAEAAAAAPAPAPAPKKPPRLLVIDLLRFIAAASVVGMHWIALGNGVGPLFGPRAQPYGRPYARDIFPHSVTDILTYGGLGVELFFLISGFVICMSSWGRTLGQFGASRIARLFPAYWFAVLLTVGVLLAFPKLPMVRDFSLVRSTLINLTMTQSFFGVGDVDPVYWTLAQELRFYLIFAIVVAFGVTYRRTLYFCWLWVFAAMFASATGNGTLQNITQPEYAPFFIGGIAFFLMWKFGPNLMLWTLVVLTFLIGQDKLTPQPPIAFGWDAPMWPMVLIVALCYVVMALVALRKLDWIRWRGLTVLGAMTYPLYLLHQEIGFTAIAYLYPRMSAKVMLPLMFGALLALCWLVHRFIERPGQRWLSKGIKQSLENMRQIDAEAATGTGGGGTGAGTGRRRLLIQQRTAAAPVSSPESTR